MRLFGPLLGIAATLAAGLAIAQAPTALKPPASAREALPPSPTLVAKPAIGAGAPLTKADADAWLDGYMPYALRAGDIPGAVVVVVKDGQVLTQRGFGYADVAKKKPVDPATTLFRPGSVSKLVTWTAVMQQVEQGKIDLDADVNRYLDEGAKVPAYEGKPVTMRQIMQHTAGFGEIFKNLIIADPKKAISMEQYLKLRMPRLIFAPGSTPAYSNYATTLAGYVVQRTSGMPFDDYVERNIFAPLGMTRSSFRQPLPANLAPLMAQGYKLGSAEPGKFEIVVPAPAGSLSSPGSDMAKFMIAHLAGGAGILKPETARQMHTSAGPQIGPLNRMELGFFETNRNGRQIIAHLGDTEFFHTSLHLLTNEGVGFYVSFNSPGKAAAVGALRTALFDDFTDRYFPSISAPDGRVDAAVAKQHAAAMAGNWLASRRAEDGWPRLLMLIGQTKVTVDKDGGLMIPDLKTAGGAPRKWVEIAPYVWREVGGHDRLAAVVKDGKPVRWSFDLIAPFTVYDRVPGFMSSSWLLPAIFVALAVLFIAFLHWPVSALARRLYGQRREFANGARVYRGIRLGAGLVVAGVIAWLVTFTAMMGSVDSFTSKNDPILWLLQIFGLIALIAVAVFAGLNVRDAWRDKRGWFGKLWAVLLVLSVLLLFWAAWLFGLIAMTVGY